MVALKHQLRLLLLAIVVGDSLNFFLSLSLPFTSCCLFAGCAPCDTNALCAAHRPPLFSQFQCPWLRQFAFHWGCCCCCCKNWCNVLSNVKHSLLSQCFYTHTQVDDDDHRDYWRVVAFDKHHHYQKCWSSTSLLLSPIDTRDEESTNWHDCQFGCNWRQAVDSNNSFPVTQNSLFTLHSLTMYI